MSEAQNFPDHEARQEARLDALEELVAKLRDENTMLHRNVSLLSRVVTASETTFTERCLVTLHNLFHNMTDLIGHQLEEIQLMKDRKGVIGDVIFEIEIVDGVKVKETADSILITKGDDNHLRLSSPSDPDNYVEGKAEHLLAWFAQRPHLFGDRKRLVFNYSEERKSVPATESPAPGTNPAA